MSYNRRASGGGLALVLAFAAIAMAIIGWVLPAPPFLQTGVTTCTVASAGTTCTTPTSTYATAYHKVPQASIVGVAYNVAPFTTLSATDAFQAVGGVNFVLPTNSTQLLLDTETSVSHTVPNTDTSLNTFAPAYWGGLTSNFSPLPQVSIQADGYVSTTATTTLQDISIKLEDSGCSGTVLSTMIVHPASSVVSKKPWSLTAVEVVAIFGTNVALCIQAPAADANTSVFMVDMHVYLVQNHFQAWPGMPAAVTELFGNTQHEQTWLFDSVGYTGTVEICASVIGLSSGVSSTLQAQYGTTNFGPTVAITSQGSQCNSASATIPMNLQTLRIVGANGGGASDIPAFGAISISWTYTITKTLSFNSFDPGNPATVAVSITGISLKYTFVGAVGNGAGVIVTLTFQVYGT